MSWHTQLWRVGRHHLFKGSAFVVTAILFVLAFIFADNWINYGLDRNLDLLRWIGDQIKILDPNWGSKFVTFTRWFNFERILLFGEAVAVVKLIMLAAGWFFRLCFRGGRTGYRRLRQKRNQSNFN